jgi:putative FmdB family regulatory protein
MPLYEYACDACGHRFEAIQKFSDPPLESCPKCGGAVRKLQSAPAFQFKGSGWYITDYARKDQGGKSDAAGKEAAGKTADKEAAGTAGDAKAAPSDGAGKSDAAAPKPAKPAAPA